MLKTKQIDWVVAGSVRVTNFSANGGSSNVTAALTTALSTAGRGGVSVPVQTSANEDGIGVVTAATLNLVQIFANATKERIAGAGGNEVYGRITETGGVYTLTYFVSVNGTETAHSFGAATAIDFDISYRYDFPRLPADFAIATQGRVVSNDPKGGSGVAALFTELMTVTALNTLSALTKTPNVASNLELIVNGETFHSFGGASAPFSLNAKAVTWNPTNARFNIDPTDRVIARYTTVE